VGQGGRGAHARLEDLVAWLAQQMAFAPLARLLRIGWHTIGPILERVVADHLDDRRLDGLVCIGAGDRRRRIPRPGPVHQRYREPAHAYLDT
jgi:hypothetical protein